MGLYFFSNVRGYLRDRLCFDLPVLVVGVGLSPCTFRLFGTLPSYTFYLLGLPSYTFYIYILYILSIYWVSHYTFCILVSHHTLYILGLSYSYLTSYLSYAYCICLVII